MNTYKLSPSDFAFLWEQCKRCFFLKVVHGIRQPSMPMAGIFKKIEALQMEVYDGRPASLVSPELAEGTIRCGEKWLESEVIIPPGAKSGCYIVGKLDSLLEFKDGGWGVLDFKTTQIKESKAALYGRQLNAYALGLERPAKKPLSIKKPSEKLSPVKKLGLLCFEPSRLDLPDAGRHSYEGEVKWLEIKRDDDAFIGFLGEAMALLDGGMPPPTPGCDWCGYAERMKRGDLPAGAPPPDAPKELCPKCESPMVRKEGRYGPFLSCTRYPACRGTRNI